MNMASRRSCVLATPDNDAGNSLDVPCVACLPMTQHPGCNDGRVGCTLDDVKSAGLAMCHRAVMIKHRMHAVPPVQIAWCLA